MNKTTECRSDKKMGRIFVDERGEKPVAFKGGKKYSIIFRDDATRMSWIYFMRKKCESPDALDQFLTDTREYGPPQIIRNDDAPQLKGKAQAQDRCASQARFLRWSRTESSP